MTRSTICCGLCRAIITGSSSGIGRSCALRLAQEGADVCVNYYSEQEAQGAEEVLGQIEAAGRKAIAVQADVGSEDDVRRMVAASAEAFGGVDILVNNAGIENQVPTMEMPLKDYSRTRVDAPMLNPVMLNTQRLLVLRDGEAAAVTRAGSRQAEGVTQEGSSTRRWLSWSKGVGQCIGKSVRY
jgi:NAD(P)-dependent dehydrogenase (short-subunit alcohol dehydrogenase family)